MNSFILSSLFFLINFVFKINADEFESDIYCTNYQNYYYNSINHRCEECLVKVYNNICYLNNQSVYGYGPMNLDKYCKDDEIMTELDDVGKHLGYLTCAATKQTLLPNDTSYGQNSYSFTIKYFQNIRRPEDAPLSNSFSLMEYSQNETSYSFNACTKGLYAKSCQYLANLCVLDMYRENSPFCQIEFDSQNI